MGEKVSVYICHHKSIDDVMQGIRDGKVLFLPYSCLSNQTVQSGQVDYADVIEDRNLVELGQKKVA